MMVVSVHPLRLAMTEGWSVKTILTCEIYYTLSYLYRRDWILMPTLPSLLFVTLHLRILSSSHPCTRCCPLPNTHHHSYLPISPCLTVVPLPTPFATVYLPILLSPRHCTRFCPLLNTHYSYQSFLSTTTCLTVGHLPLHLHLHWALSLSTSLSLTTTTTHAP